MESIFGIIFNDSQTVFMFVNSKMTSLYSSISILYTLLVSLNPVSVWLPRSLTATSYIPRIILILLSYILSPCCINALPYGTWIISYYILWSHEWIRCSICFAFSIWIFRVDLSHVSASVVVMLDTLKQVSFWILILILLIWSTYLLINISNWLLRLSLLRIHYIRKLLIPKVIRS